MAAQSFNHYHPSQTAMFSCLDYSLSASVHAPYSLFSGKKAGSSFKNLSDHVISLVSFPVSLLLKSKLFTVVYKVLYYLYPTYYLSDHKTFYSLPCLLGSSHTNCVLFLTHVGYILNCLVLPPASCCPVTCTSCFLLSSTFCCPVTCSS